MSVGELKRALEGLGVGYRDCLEKSVRSPYSGSLYRHSEPSKLVPNLAISNFKICIPLQLADFKNQISPCETEPLLTLESI